MLVGRRATVLVYPVVAVTDSVYGNTLQVPATDPVTVHGIIQPSSSAEYAVEGQVAGQFIKFLCSKFPAGPWARVHWDDKDWEVVGVPNRYTSFRSLNHDTVSLKARFEVVPNGE